MTRAPKELLPIIQAFAEGKSLQYRNLNQWVDYADDDPVLDIGCWRIKPVPQDFWLVRDFKESALEVLLKKQHAGLYAEVKHVREVME